MTAPEDGRDVIVSVEVYGQRSRGAWLPKIKLTYADGSMDDFVATDLVRCQTRSAAETLAKDHARPYILRKQVPTVSASNTNNTPDPNTTTHDM